MVYCHLQQRELLHLYAGPTSGNTDLGQFLSHV